MELILTLLPQLVALCFHLPGSGIRDSGAMACFSLAIRDTGIGIDPNFHASLFQAFSQKDSVAEPAP